jgi:hypothetical protein
MKNVSLFRLFIAFPLIAIVLPNAAFSFEDAGYRIPAWHFIVFAFLIAVLLVSYLFKQDKLGKNERLLNR